MKRIAIYSRKSVLTDKGESTKVQINLCKDYFTNQKDCVFEIFEDEGYSGGNINRPAFKLLMDKVKYKEFDIVAVYKIDRIARNIKDFFNIFDILEQHNVSLISITEGFDPTTPLGRMNMTMLAGFAEMERMNIKERVRDNMLQLAKTGKWTGGNPPIGYSSVRKDENGKKATYLKKKDDDHIEIEIIKRVYNLFLSGLSTRKIVSIINSDYDLKTSQKRVCNILYSPTYTESTIIMNKHLETLGYECLGDPNGFGYLTYNKRTNKWTGTRVQNKNEKVLAVPSKHEAIIDNDTWIRVSHRLSEVTQNPKPRKSQFTYLSRLVKCYNCGSGMHVDSEPRKYDEPQRFFRKSCNCNPNKYYKRLTIDRAESMFLNALSDLCDVNILESLYSKNNMSNKLNFPKEMKKIEIKISTISKKIDNLTDKLAIASDSVVDVLLDKITLLVDEKCKLQDELLILQTQKNRTEIDSLNINLFKDELSNMIKSIKDDKLTYDEINFKLSTYIDGLYWNPETQKLIVRLKI